jgi:hypothetical protein
MFHFGISKGVPPRLALNGFAGEGGQNEGPKKYKKGLTRFFDGKFVRPVVERRRGLKREWAPNRIVGR